MDKEEILQKSREEYAAGYMDERERRLCLRRDSFAFGAGLVLACLMIAVKVQRGAPAADLLTLITGTSASGFAYMAVKTRRKAYIIAAILTALLAVFYFYRFFVGRV